MNMPKRADEVELWNSFGCGTPHEWPRDAAAAMGMPWRRLQYLCEKWASQGVYDYGTSCDMGWKEPQRCEFRWTPDFPGAPLLQCTNRGDMEHQHHWSSHEHELWMAQEFHER